MPMKIEERINIRLINITLLNHLSSNHIISTTILLLTVSAICTYLPYFAQCVLPNAVFDAFCKYCKYGRNTALYSLL